MRPKPKFKGYGDFYGYWSWERSLEAYFQENDIQDFAELEVALDCLTGEARYWWLYEEGPRRRMSRGGYIKSWEHLRHLLRRRYAANSHEQPHSQSSHFVFSPTRRSFMNHYPHSSPNLPPCASSYDQTPHQWPTSYHDRASDVTPNFAAQPYPTYSCTYSTEASHTHLNQEPHSESSSDTSSIPYLHEETKTSNTTMTSNLDRLEAEIRKWLALAKREMKVHHGEVERKEIEWKVEGLRERESVVAQIPKKDPDMATKGKIEERVSREENVSKDERR